MCPYLFVYIYLHLHLYGKQKSVENTSYRTETAHNSLKKGTPCLKDAVVLVFQLLFSIPIF